MCEDIFTSTYIRISIILYTYFLQFGKNLYNSPGIDFEIS